MVTERTSMIDDLRNKADASEARDLAAAGGQHVDEPVDNHVDDPVDTTDHAVDTSTDNHPAHTDNIEQQADLTGNIEGATTQTPPEYHPNYNFKVHDQEREVDEWIRPLIKDAETEKQVRDLYERAYGLEHVKQDRQTLRDDNTRMRAELDEFGKVKNDLRQLGHFLQNGDMQSFFEAHEIPDERIFQYAMQKLQMRENPELQTQYDQNRLVQNQQYNLQRENENLRQQQQQIAYDRKQEELRYVMSDPTVRQAEQEYNARMGQDAFRNEVIARGSMHYRTTQQDLSARDAVDQVLKVMGYQPAGQAGGAQTFQQPVNTGMVPPNTVQQQAQVPMQGQQPGQPPVIPNIKGRSSTPVRKQPRSIQELRNLSNQMNG